jgi:hypothetical protein
MKKEEEYPSGLHLLSSWEGGWMSVNGNPNPDVYIFQGCDGNYFLLAYSYEKESGRSSFTLYDIDQNEDGCYIRMGMKYYRLSEEKFPYGLSIGEWGSYMKN